MLGGDLDEIEPLAELLHDDPSLTYAIPHPIGPSPDVTPGDRYWVQRPPAGDFRGPLEAIEMPAAWEWETDADGVSVGVIDGDFDTNHVDYPDNVTINGTGSPSFDSHGTHVAGTICAQGDNEIGIAGIVWSCDLTLYGADDSPIPPGLIAEYESIHVEIGWLEEMLQAIEDRQDIVNISLGSPQRLWRDEDGNSLWTGNQIAPTGPEWEMLLREDPDLRRDVEAGRHNWDAVLEYEERVGADILWVTAAGNDGVDILFGNKSQLHSRANVLVVANADTTIDVAVAPAERRFALNTSSNRGVSGVSVAAPGTEIVSLFQLDGDSTTDSGEFAQEGYGIMTGTSMAAPHVAGLAALLKSINPSLTAAELKDCIVDGAERGNTAISFQPFFLINAPESVVACGGRVGRDPSVFLTEFVRVALLGSTAPICQAPPSAFQVISTDNASGQGDPSTFFVVDIPAGVSLRGSAYFDTNVEVATGRADDQVVRFDAYYTNLDTGANTRTPDPFTLWQQRPDRPATVVDRDVRLSQFQLVGNGPVRVEARAGTQIYRNQTGSVVATVFLRPFGASCIQSCVEAGGELYVEDPASFRGETIGGCYAFGPQLDDFLRVNPDALASAAISAAFAVADVAVEILMPGPSNSTVPTTSYIVTQAPIGSANILVATAEVLEDGPVAEPGG